MFSWQAGLITFLVLQHFRWVVFSIYVHRGISHRMFEFTPVLSHIFRFYLWFSMKYTWPNWMQYYAAQHRKHHRYSDLPEDPHSPYQLTFKQLLYDFDQPDSSYALTPEEIQQYAPDVVTADDWVQKNVYGPYPKLGLAIYWLLSTILFGWFGFVVGMTTYLFMDQIGIFLSNWVMHKVGFSYAVRKETGDRSKIVFPLGIIMAGESLHTRHHNDPGNPNFAHRWWEFDTGWWYCQLLMSLKLMKLVDKGFKRV